MNKTELIEHIAKHADISKAAATRALEATIGAVKTTLKKGGSVSLVGFGTFAVGAPICIAVGVGLNASLHKLVFWCCMGVLARCIVFTLTGYFGMKMI